MPDNGSCIARRMRYKSDPSPTIRVPSSTSPKSWAKLAEPNNQRQSLSGRKEADSSVEVPGDRVEEAAPTAVKSGLRGLVRRLSFGGGPGGRAIGSCARPGPAGPELSANSAAGTSPSGGGGPVVGAGTTTVSASGAPAGRGTLSRRSSRDLSPSKSSSSSSAGQDASGHGGGGGAGAAGGQDWRRLVGSIRRKVRRKTGQGSASISEAALHETNRNQDDFLKATMRIFLVVSPPMGRVQVRSRSLTQLDALGSSMLDTGEHHLGGGPSQQQAHQLHHHHQAHPLQHHAQNVAECSPRFLVPNAPSTDGQHCNRTRHKLSRSQVSSSEYFSVSFEVGEDSASFDREEFLPAIKGTYLAEALTAACERRGVDLTRVDVLDSFSAVLPILTTDTSCLGGKHLRVIGKDEKSNSRSASQRANQSIPLRKASGSYRGRSGRFFSVSTEDSSVDSEIGANALPSGRSSAGAAGLKASKQRWSGFFTNTKGTKMDLLTAQLDDYNKHGVPKLPDVQLPYEVAHNEDALYNLEDDWRDIVESSDLLSEKQQQQQTALWELAQTEVAYIKTLKVVTDLFMACLCSLQASNILNEVDRTKLFSNIPDIYAANRYFWTEHLLAMVNASKSTGQPLDPGHLLQGFETFEQTFAPYTRYCAEQSRCQQYCRDRLNDNQLFTAYLVWCETQKDCNRLKLLDILVKPMQRLTKYSLLLKAVHKNTENEEQRAELTQMIKSVDDFVASVNAALRRSEETARLAGAASRLESYDVVESRDEELEKLIKIHSNLDISTVPIPGCPKDTLRTLLREGDLKLRDAATSKMEVHVLLLTDMLLICKPSTKKTSSSGSAGNLGGGLKIIRQPYVVDRIRIHELKEPSSLGLVYLNEYGAASAALVLSAGEPKLAKSWMESLRKAQQQFALMKVPPLGSTMNLGTVSRQPSTFLGDVDFEGEECEGIPRTPRGSSRASRVSSLAHSHSGSMEMEGVSPGSSTFLPSYNASRNVSVDTNEPPRASSVSSEEGGETGSGHNHRPLQIRRSLLSKSPTPNTLSVQVPAYSSLGQSLPNLTLATSPQTSTVSPTPPNSLLIVPQITKSKETLLSPGHRGISYPPPSPPRGALRRAFAIPQSRNPPLIKTRHVNTSVTQMVQPAMSLDTEAIEERRRRLEPSHRVPSTSSIVEEKK
ncbi:hypothetical protein KM043_007279 [Ampulex compressa]|nr:hypothetical protein KM043_007279 [Ampulex compressa]